MAYTAAVASGELDLPEGGAAPPERDEFALATADELEPAPEPELALAPAPEPEPVGPPRPLEAIETKAPKAPSVYDEDVFSL